MISLERIKNIVKDIKSDKEWVNDSHTEMEYYGVVKGLNQLLIHLMELEKHKDV
jgi:hypothetical protein